MECRGVSSENERDKPMRLCFRGNTHARDPGVERVEYTGGERSVVVVALDDVAASFCKGKSSYSALMQTQWKLIEHLL